MYDMRLHSEIAGDISLVWHQISVPRSYGNKRLKNAYGFALKSVNIFYSLAMSIIINIGSFLMQLG